MVVRPISHDDTAREFERLVTAVKVRGLTDEEVKRFASLLGKFVLLSTGHPGAVEMLERDDVKHAIWELGLQLGGQAAA